MGNNEETWMTDQFGRDITYLRISVTELCNLRCRYCMPEEGVCKKSHADMLTEDEMIQAVAAAASLGITKLRITGGEPLVKKNITSICRRAAAVDGIREVCVTTNGILLPELARSLKEAGVRRLNLSLDTLHPEKYAYITRTGVEMEALTAVSIVALTVCDMCKAVQKDMVITDIRLLSKTGGVHGDYFREE